MKIDKILVANRGEIAIRIMRACREMGIKSVAVYSEADKDALFARYADEAYPIGPAQAAQSYLDIKKIIGVAVSSGAQAIHPGYGFLSENPSFSYACEKAGIKFIGPSSHVLALMGNKVAARTEMKKAGVPVVPGCEDLVNDLDHAKKIAADIGYPVIVKPCGGGGGIGMKVANCEIELEEAITGSQKMADKAFGVPDVYIEKFIREPRHIEFQIMGDSYGNIVYLGERECSIQRRYQKLIEESPSPAITPELRSKMGEVAVRVGRWVKYQSAGTVEFIFSNGEFYFMEANTRVQVEHPVTEMVTGIDIVKEQIRVAQGLPLPFSQEDIKLNGWAIECRINAEDPLAGFAPSTGKLRGYRSPGGIGVRVDSGVHTRYTIPYMYDPMISKLIVWGRDRDEAIMRMRRALYEYIIVGVKTNINFHKAVMANPRFIAGNFGTHFIDNETTLLDDMKHIMEEEKTLEAKLSEIFDQSSRAAAIAAVAAVMQGAIPEAPSSDK
ncbi:MAG: acetyl-CoA carboxylase biotin carboxylase subunit [Dehalococcoidia bacterium]|nr:acetyl-CoA carboxylase biotin carboxylase subunit [Dehalococcoidia bacterium]